MSIAVAGARHMHALIGSLGRLVRNPFSTGLTILVIALALALPTALRLLVLNAQTATGGFSSAVDLSVYLKTDTPLVKAQQLERNVRERPDVASVELISADKAMEEFRKYSGFGVALESLKDNPLPHVLHVQPRTGAQSAAAVESLRRYFGAWPEVDIVQVDTEWVMRFNAILDVLRNLLAIAAVLLGAGVLAVIGNTIRLEILNRRAEIEVTKLVGGSNAFVRRPFLYTGVLYGLAGALLAWAIVETAVIFIGRPIATLAEVYGSHFILQGPPPDDVGVLLATGIVLGWMGAWIFAESSRGRNGHTPRLGVTVQRQGSAPRIGATFGVKLSTADRRHGSASRLSIADQRHGSALRLHAPTLLCAIAASPPTLRVRRLPSSAPSVAPPARSPA